MKRIGGIFEGFLVIPTELIIRVNLLLSFVMCITINYPFLVNIMFICEKNVFQFSKKKNDGRTMEMEF